MIELRILNVYVGRVLLQSKAIVSIVDYPAFEGDVVGVDLFKRQLLHQNMVDCMNYRVTSVCIQITVLKSASTRYTGVIDVNVLKEYTF
jgi:hypothetical protein